jgi:2TM domain
MIVTDETRRDLAMKRLKEKNDFRIHLLIYLSVNAMLVVIWAMTGGLSLINGAYTFAFFWPIFVIVGWGIGVLAHGYSIYFGNLYSEDQIQREMQKLPH